MAGIGGHEIKSSFRLNMRNPQHVKINNVIQNLNPDIFKSKNQFLIDACQFYIDHYGEEGLMTEAEKKRDSYLSQADLEDIRKELIEKAVTEARKEVIKLLGGVISGMAVSRMFPELPSGRDDSDIRKDDVMEDADVAGFAMEWMGKGD